MLVMVSILPHNKILPVQLLRHLGHGRSATAMAAYEGQSGSKDRGDPQVSQECTT